MQAFTETIRSLGSPLWSKSFELFGHGARMARWQHTDGRVAFAAPDMVRVVLNLAGSPLVHHTEGSKTISVKSLPGNISVMLPFVPTETIICGNADVIQLFLAPDVLRSVCPLDALRSSSVFPYAELTRQMLRLLVTSRLQSDRCSNSTDSRAEVEIAVLLAAFANCEKICSPQTAFNPGPVQRVERLIEDAVNNARPLELKTMARVAGWSPTHLLRVFRNNRGIAPHQLLLMRRLERAMDLLLKTRMQVAEISDAVGFSSPAHFIAFFRQRLGITPTAYRRALQPACDSAS